MFQFVYKVNGTNFSDWLRRHYLCYKSLLALASPITEILELMESQPTYLLIAEDDGISPMSMVSSDFGVKARGFRKIPPAPVYGAQTPTRKELAAIYRHCTVAGKRWGHTSLLWMDLRNYPAIYIGGTAYIVTDMHGQYFGNGQLVVDNGFELEKIEQEIKTMIGNSPEKFKFGVCFAFFFLISKISKKI